MKMAKNIFVFPISIAVTLTMILRSSVTDGFLIGVQSGTRTITQSLSALNVVPDDSKCDEIGVSGERRSLLRKAMTAPLLIGGLRIQSQPANAAVGTLPEFADTNAILQGLTITVADQSQQDAMIKFLENGFEFTVTRKRIQQVQGGQIEDTWLAFGPEQLSTPSDFRIPVSSFAMNGGHCSIQIRYDSRLKSPLYNPGDSKPSGDNIAFIQVGVPGYRISQMVANGGYVIDAYGFVNVISPAGIPMRSIVGIWPDPLMFVAINCADVKKSKELYEQLGFVEQEYPYSRLSKGTTPFEPAQPKGSVYMSPSPNCMGVLLLQSKKKKITPNPALQSLNIIYSPSEGSEGEVSYVEDLSGVPIKFQPAAQFSAEEKITR